MSTKPTLDHNAIEANRNIAARNYWRNRLQHLEFGDYFNYAPRAVNTSEKPRVVTYTVTGTDALNNALGRIALSLKARHVFLLSALGVIAGKYAGVEEVCLFTPLYSSGLKTGQAGIMLPVRISLAGEPAFKTLLGNVKNDLLQDMAYGTYPLERILQKEEKAFVPEVSVGMLVKEIQAVPEEGSFVPALLFSFSLTAQLVLEIQYDTARFEESYIAAIAQYYLDVLTQLLQNPDIGFSKATFLSAAAEGILLQQYKDTAVPLPEAATVITLFEQQAAAAPDKTALISGSQTVSYGQLQQQADRVAAYLQHTCHIQAGDLVGILLDRELLLLPVMLGVLKSGAAYVPIDPAYPAERITAIVTDARVKVLFTTQPALTVAAHTQVVLPDVALQANLPVQPLSATHPGGLAYVLYTSGSTGRPKGVKVSHHSLLNYAHWAAGHYLEGGPAVFALFTSIAFDLTVTSIFTPLITGNAIALYEEADKGQLIGKVLSDGIAEVIKLTPSHLRVIRSTEFVPEAGRTFTFIVGGEALETALSQGIHQQFNGQVKIYNEYGPTEATVGCMIYQFDPADTLAVVPIGTAIQNTQIHLLNADLQPVAAGIPGEIYIAGTGVAAGYLLNETLTAERFITDPFSAGGRMYRTGDLAVRLPDGRILYRGRNDEQLKIRGYRIEPGEIAQQLLLYPGIKEAVVVAIEKEGNKYLVAYYVAGSPLDATVLTTYLQARLPVYMVPTFFIPLEQLPLTTNGKLHVKALPAPEWVATPAYEPAADETEAKLVELWAAVLKREPDTVSVTQSFLTLGGNSLMAIVLTNKIFKQLNVKIAIKDFFEQEHIRAMGRFIRGAEKSGYTSIRKVLSKPHYKVSSAQRRLYFLYEVNKTSLAYNITTAVTLEGALDTDRLQAAFRALVTRHESLRTCFDRVKEEPVQKIIQDMPFEVARFTTDATGVQATIRTFRQPFDVNNGPLIRAALITVAPEEHVLAVDMHHIISDGISLSLLVKDFMALYNGDQLPALRLQYKDYAAWQQSKEQQEKVRSSEAFWLQEFAAVPAALELPTDYPRPAIKNHHGSRLRFELDETMTARLSAIAEQEGSTLYMLFLAAFNILLAKLGGREDITVGTSTAGRQHPELENIIGMFVNMLTIRNYPAGHLSFKTFLAAVKTKTLACFEGQDYQYEQLIEAIKPERDMSRNPLFDVMFDFNNFEGEALQIPGLTIRSYPAAYTISKFDLTLSCTAMEGKIYGNLEYATDLFREETIERFIHYFKNITAAIAADADLQLADISLLSPEEKVAQLQTYNATAAPLPEAETVVTLFEQQAAADPENVALISGEHTVSYGQLQEQVNRVAAYLQNSCHIQTGELVGILLDRELSLIPVMLGILKSGAAYVPIDPAYPAERILSIVTDAGLKVLFAVHPDAELAAHTRVISPEVALESALPEQQLPVPNQAALAYVLYTSGSTGRPKGVQVGHRSLLNYVHWAAGQYLEGRPGTFALFTSIAFDLTVTTIFTPLITGNAIALYEGEDKGQLIGKVLTDGVADVIKLTPSHLRVIRSMGWEPEGFRAITLIVGGEALETALSQDIYHQFNGLVRIYNEYGPTETTVGCMIYRFNPADTLPAVPIGVPIHNTQIYLLDGYLKPVAVGVPGEIYVGGTGVAEGYLKNEALTAERFIPDPFTAGGRMYKTGDLAVRLADGKVVYRGRTDEQLKIRGYRIEPGDIAQHLLSYPGIREAVVVAGEKEGSKYLIAYYVATTPLDGNILAAHLEVHLPVYMIPAFFVRIDELPLTTNGKLNKKALPAPEATTTGEHLAPLDETEVKLVQLWAEVLKIDAADISIDASFFQLGGHSLLAIELISKVLREMQVELPLDVVFDHDNVRAMATYIRGTKKSAYAVIPVAAKKEHYALSATQKEMYFLHGLDQASLAYNMPRVVKLEGKLDKDKLAHAFTTLVARHEIFRTAFHIVEETPVQVIVEDATIAISHHQTTEAAVKPLMEQLIRPFDLSVAPLLRVALVETGGAEHFLLVDTHHIIMDGTSNGILIKEFVALYKGETLPPLRLQYKDYVEWQQSPDRQLAVQAQRAFWKEQFADGIPVLELPVDHPRPLVKNHAGSTIDFSLDETTTAAVKSLAASENATLFMVLLSVYNVLLAKMTGQHDLIVGASVSGRKHEDLKNLMGLFLDTLPMRNQLRTDQSFRDFLKAVRTRTLQCFDHQAYEYEILANELNIRRNGTHNALFDVMFAVQNYEKATFELPELSFQTYSRKGYEAKFDMTLTATEQGDRIYLSLEYSTQLFERATIERCITWFRNILSGVLADTAIRIGDIEMMAGTEREQILHTFNQPAIVTAPGQTVLDLFTTQVQLHGNNPAIWFDQQTISYAVLDEKTNQLAHYLAHDAQAETEEVIALCMDRSPVMLVALLAILKTGAAYVALEPSLPASRIATILQEAGVKRILTNTVLAGAADWPVTLIDIRKEQAIINGYPVTPLPVTITGNQLAYVIYTSGSTGIPKGIEIEHRSLIDYALTFRDYFGVTHTDKVVQQSSLSFDTAVEEIFPALISGAQLLLMQDGGMNVPHLLQVMQQEGATILSTTPLVLNELNRQAAALPPLRVLISGGDVLRPEYIDQLAGRFQVYNTYGPAESTVCVTYHPLTGAGDTQVIGKPVRNREVLILNRVGGLCPVGVRGEIAVSGAGLARGYLHQPGATAAKFIPHPYNPAARLYLTGDEGRWLPDGSIAFLGRTDGQVKIRGYRVETAEIENVLLAIPGIREAVVLSYEPAPGDRKLAAFLVLEDTTLNVLKIKKQVRDKLAGYMVPAHFIPVAGIPATVNGKTDTAALLALIPVTTTVSDSYRAPQDKIQQQLAAIWQELLQVEKAGLDDTFFDLGGHSLLLIKQSERIKKTFRVTLPLNIFFYQTLEQIAAAIAAEKTHS
ncbi:non-ribosomal peptide synthetase [Chitinophaga nivalis]|uniref:Amino acid adenylation domain-containing protein n=1 Tax=Chitinophaga nivalis TaxID=2991709 RepID=A0ABT3IJT3_9BACT|nr:non-ribosomal peptide synthetase [Chitinophaga nivalis]MCW3466083.1 amino acid adenylation domain-containing protein [Chitinophaga nivalis]MCW3484226.1 amino acid adenylation domain-containing protein [Chitinophaga nivalis]